MIQHSYRERNNLMNKIYAKIKSQGAGIKYRVFLESKHRIYKCKDELIEEVVPYDPATNVESGVWYCISSFSQKEFAIDLITKDINPVDYSMLSRNEYDSIDYLFEVDSEHIYFQKIGKARLVRKKGILRIGNEFKFYDDYAAIPINDSPDAIYDRSEDKLYFKELSSITGIFNGISDLYREATDKETEDFLTQDFIVLGTDFTVEKVKTPNRKRIALAMETLSKLSKKDRKNIFTYITGYCPKIKKDEKSFSINSDDELKLLLYGIEERFYTTQVGKEKRIANSVIKL